MARHGHAAPLMPMLLASALLWAAVWGLYTLLPQHRPAAAPAPVSLQPLPVKTFGQPTLSIALAEAPAPVTPRRKAQRVRTDIIALFGHVAGTLVRDELETMVLRLSLGQQVAVHLRQDYLD